MLYEKSWNSETDEMTDIDRNEVTKTRRRQKNHVYWIGTGTESTWHLASQRFSSFQHAPNLNSTAKVAVHRRNCKLLRTKNDAESGEISFSGMASLDNGAWRVQQTRKQR